MALQLVLGSSGAGKSHFVYETMIRESMKNEKTNYIVLVPEQFTLQTQKDLVTMHPNHGIMNIDILSFLRLAYHVFDEVGGNDRMILEDTGKIMIVKKVLMERKSDLIMFGANIKKQGFIDEMKSIISELLQYSIHSEELMRMQEVAGNKKLLSNKLKDISTIYEGYEDFLKDRYISAEELLDVLCEVIDESSIIRDSVICLDGFTGFTPSQYNLLSHLMKKAKMVYVTVTIDEREAAKKQEEHELFYLSGKTMEKLSKTADEARVEILDPIILKECKETNTLYRYRHSKPLSVLEHNIFRYPYKTYDEEQNDITISAAKNAFEEVRHTIIEVRRLVREEGYRYKDIAIVTGDIETYGDILKREFAQVSIPCFVDQKKNILTNPVVELIRSAIDLIDHNFTYEGVMRFLKCGLTGFDKDSVEHFENYILAQGIRGLSMYLKEWTRTYRSNYDINLEEVNQVRQRLVDELTPLYQTLTNAASDVTACVTAIYELLSYYRTEEQLAAYTKMFKLRTQDEDLQRAKEYEQVYRLVLEVFDRIVELLGKDVLPLREFKDILETGLKEVKVGLIPPGVDQILVGDIERTRLKDIKALFFLGVNDGVVPKANPGGGILSDVERQLFADNDIELSPTKRQNAYMTEFYLYLNLTKPQNKLYLSYAKIDGSGKSMRASYLLGKIMKLFPKLAIQHVEVTTDNTEDINQILSTDHGLTYLIGQLRDYEPQKDTEIFHELYKLYLDGTIGNKVDLDHILDGVFYKNYESGLTQKVAQKLYGETLVGSVTRMERYAACAFAHFMEYGLNLEERKEYQVSVPDIGNIFHEALERFSNKLRESDYTWHNLPKEKEVEFGKESVQEAVTDFGNGILESSKRNAYLVTRVERILLKTVEMLTKQLKSGKFEPEMYEQFFAHADRFLNLHGRIDRLDVYQEDNTLYVKVIDYKSGSTSFDLMSLYYGLQLQLGVYLSAAMSFMKEENPDKEIVPAGVFYYNLDDPIVDKSSHTQEDVAKKLRMNGLANASKEVIALMDQNFVGPDGGIQPSIKSNVIPVETSRDGEFTKRSSIATINQFDELQTYITDLMHKFSVEIMQGQVKHNPYKMKNKDACGYCKFSSMCGFDCKIEGYRYHKLKDLKNDDVWAKLLEGEEEDGDDVDTTTEESN